MCLEKDLKWTGQDEMDPLHSSSFPEWNLALSAKGGFCYNLMRSQTQAFISRTHRLLRANFFSLRDNAGCVRQRRKKSIDLKQLQSGGIMYFFQVYNIGIWFFLNKKKFHLSPSYITINRLEKEQKKNLFPHLEYTLTTCNQNTNTHLKIYLTKKPPSTCTA